MNHVVIIGFMGSGKTRVGKRLAKDFDLPFIDIDRVVTRKMNLSVKDIFDKFGEPFYRALETTVIKELIKDQEQKVISLGSGLPMQEQNEKYIKQLGTDRSNTIFIGDQLFTDIYGAKRAGIRNILVKPINPREEIQIVLKRYLEKIVLYFYKKEEGNS